MINSPLSKRALLLQGVPALPSCNAHRIAERAALGDDILAPLTVREWVLSVPKRLRSFPRRAPRVLDAALHIFRRTTEVNLRQTNLANGAQVRLGAIGVVHSFGAALNRNVHDHCCIIDGLFEPGRRRQVRFLHAPAPMAEEIAVIGAFTHRATGEVDVRSIELTRRFCLRGQ